MNDMQERLPESAQAYALALVCCFVTIWAFLETDTWAAARASFQDEQSVLPLRPGARSNGSGLVILQPDKEHVQWAGRKYELEDGVGILMNVIVSSVASVEDREKALYELGSVARTQTGGPRITILLDHYPELDNAELRRATLVVLEQSYDPRALPLFYHVLDRENDDSVRLFAAAGLAAWNIRRGVKELLGLITSKSSLGAGHIVGEESLKLIQNRTRTQGWEFPVRSVAKEVSRNVDAKRDELRVLWHDRFSHWFETNNRRFPNWTPTDPLPEIEMSGSGSDNGN